MNDYRAYGPHDFLTDDWFLAWVKYDYPDARAFWEAFSRDNPGKRGDLLLAKDMAEALHRRRTALPDGHVQREVAEILRLTAASEVTRLPVPQRTQPFRRTRWVRWAAPVAASVLLLTGWALWRTHRPVETESKQAKATTPPPMAGRIVQTNGTSEAVTISLPDGSELVLEPHSQATYPARFNADRREVWLTGNARFSVVRDVRRPFLVRSGALVTRVLGTRFRVHAPTNSTRITVSVQHGKVSVYDQPDRENETIRPNHQAVSIVLTANQQVMYDAEEKTMIRSLVEKPTILLPESALKSFTFKSTAVSTILKAFEQAYGVDMVYDESVLNKCKLTTSLTNETLFEKLDILCEAIGATYKVADAQVIIEGPGCK